MKSFIALTITAFTLASCGGGGALGPTSRDVGILPSGFVATLDGATDEVVLTIDGVEVARLVNAGAPGEFTTYSDGDDFAMYGQTISGDGSFFVTASPTVDLNLAGVQVNRLGDTNLPSSGSAIFNGNYGGFFVDSDLLAVAFVQGAAQLTADFASASISGDITNRLADGGPADDVLLLPTAITSAGAFSGTTTGGDVVGDTTANDGAYVGLIVGATGNELVGGVTITHVFGADFLLEIGAFVAAE